MTFIFQTVQFKLWTGHVSPIGFDNVAAIQSRISENATGQYTAHGLKLFKCQAIFGLSRKIHVTQLMGARSGAVDNKRFDLGRLLHTTGITDRHVVKFVRAIVFQFGVDGDGQA